MDPVNKWLLTIISFMIAVLAVLYYTAGSGRYQMTITRSALVAGHSVVYVLDTKDGEVKAQLASEEDLQYDGRPRNTSKTVFSIDPPNRYGYNR